MVGAVLAAVGPVFALVAAGALARRAGVMGAGTVTELNRFVVWLALPALLFDITVHAGWAEIWQPRFVLAFGGGSGVVFAATVLLRRRVRPLADAAIDGLNAGYANTGFMGFSLAAAALGPGALPFVLVATVFTACVLFAVAIVLIELGAQEGAGGWRLGWRVASNLGRNPLLVAPVAGVVAHLMGPEVWPGPVEGFLRLLGAAASPCALVTLGLFLGGTGPVGSRAEGVLAAAKLVVQPALTWVLAVPVLGLPVLPAHAAVLLAALPTGTGPFMLAEFYRREAAPTGRVVLFTTVVSVVTVSALLAASRG